MMLVGRAGTRRASLHLEAAGFGSAGTPGAHDLLLRVHVDVGGYAAVDEVWIQGEALEAFLAGLAALERRRQGRARLEGVVPEDFALTFFSTDRVGHMAVRGRVRHLAPEGHALQLRFGFWFEPDLLPGVLADFRGMREA